MAFKKYCFGFSYPLAMMLKNFLSSEVGRELIYKEKGVDSLMEFFSFDQLYWANYKVAKQCLLLLLKYPKGQSKHITLFRFSMCFTKEPWGMSI
jgi:hypothetical protein